MRESIAISEIFGPTVQGEGPLIGQPTVFVRTGGCDYRCVWCDTLYAVLPEHRSEWVLMKPTEIEDASTNWRAQSGFGHFIRRQSGLAAVGAAH